MEKYKCKVLLHVELDIETTLPFPEANQLIISSTQIRKTKKLSKDLSITNSRLVNSHRTY